MFIADCDPICALQACIDILQVAAIERVVPEMDISCSSHWLLLHPHFGPHEITQVDHFVFSVGHAVIVPASRPTSTFALRHWLSIFRCRRSSMRKWRNCTLSYSVQYSPSLPKNKQITSVSTTVIEIQRSAEDVVAFSGFGTIGDLDELFADRACAGELRMFKKFLFCQLMD